MNVRAGTRFKPRPCFWMNFLSFNLTHTYGKTMYNSFQSLLFIWACHDIYSFSSEALLLFTLFMSTHVFLVFYLEQLVVLLKQTEELHRLLVRAQLSNQPVELTLSLFLFFSISGTLSLSLSYSLSLSLFLSPFLSLSFSISSNVSLSRSFFTSSLFLFLSDSFSPHTHLADIFWTSLLAHSLKPTLCSSCTNALSLTHIHSITHTHTQ